jgi:hypothetical protein
MIYVLFQIDYAFSCYLYLISLFVLLFLFFRSFTFQSLLIRKIEKYVNGEIEKTRLEKSNHVVGMSALFFPSLTF